MGPELLRSLRDHVHERLRRAIVAGQFANGERLNERALSVLFGVSTTPVKDAIRMLESEGLVCTKARSGVFVVFSARQAMEMALARSGLESVMAHIAANEAAAADLDALGACIGRMERATSGGDTESLVQLNEQYHNTIHRIAACDYLVRRLDGQRTYDHAQRIALLTDPIERDLALIEHRRIFEAIADRDARAAEVRMREHIVRSARRHVRQIFGEVDIGVAYDV